MSGVAWIVMTTDDLRDYLVAAQATAIRTAALEDGQADTFTKIWQEDVSLRIRAKIASASNTVLSATPYSIPPEIKWIGAMLLIETLQQRLPSLKLTEDQKTKLERAYTQLDRIADGKDEVSTPDDAVAPDVQRGGTIVVVTSSARLARRSQLNGL